MLQPQSNTKKHSKTPKFQQEQQCAKAEHNEEKREKTRHTT